MATSEPVIVHETSCFLQLRIRRGRNGGIVQSSMCLCGLGAERSCTGKLGGSFWDRLPGLWFLQNRPWLEDYTRLTVECLDWQSDVAEKWRLCWPAAKTLEEIIKFMTRFWLVMLLHRRKYCPTLQTNEYRLGDKIGWCIDASTLCEHERGGEREREKKERERVLAIVRGKYYFCSST